MRQINEQNTRVEAAKFKQKEFYMKYLRRNHQEDIPLAPLQESLEVVKKARFGKNVGHSKIGAGLGLISKQRNEVQMPEINRNIQEVKPLITREDMAFLNQRGNDKDFPIDMGQKPMAQAAKEFKSRLIKPSKFEKVASNLDALDLELSQTKKLYELVDRSNPHIDQVTGKRQVGGDLMESLDLNTGYNGLLEKRQNEMAHHLANKYKLDLDQFQKDEQMLQNIDLGQNLIQDKNWLQNSIRQSVLQWKAAANGENQNKEGIGLNSKGISSGQQLLDQELKGDYSEGQECRIEPEEVKADEPIVPVYDGPGYAVIHRGQKPQPKREQPIALPKPPVPAASKPPTKPNLETRSMISDTQSKASVRTRVTSQSRQQKNELLKSDILSKEEEARLIKEKREKMEEVRKKYSRRSRQNSSTRAASNQRETSSATGSVDRREEASNATSQSKRSVPRRRFSPAIPRGNTTTTTRAEDLNVEAFMREDMNQVNKEEDKLQKDLRALHLNNIHKHAKIIQKQKIDITIRSTKELVRKLLFNEKEPTQMDKPQLHQMQSAVNRQQPQNIRKKQEPTEDEINESLENIEMLLANIKQGVASKERALLRLSNKFNLQEKQGQETSNIEANSSGYNQSAKKQRQEEIGVASEQEKGASLELKKANLDQLPNQPMTYQQPFVVGERENTFITGGAIQADDCENDSLKAEPDAGPQAPLRQPIHQVKPQNHSQSVKSFATGRSGSQSRRMPQAKNQSALPPLKQQSKQSALFPPLKGQTTPKGSQKSQKQQPIAFSFEDSPQPKDQKSQKNLPMSNFVAKDEHAKKPSNAEMSEQLLQQQKMLQKNIDMMMELQRKQMEMKTQAQTEQVQQQAAQQQKQVFYQRNQPQQNDSHGDLLDQLQNQIQTNQTQVEDYDSNSQTISKGKQVAGGQVTVNPKFNLNQLFQDD